jgi:hypothetical protein
LASLREIFRVSVAASPRYVNVVLNYLYGISLRMFLASTADTNVDRRNFLFRFFPLLESRWLLKPLFLLILPLPVTLNLLAAARLVFIFGT